MTNPYVSIAERLATIEEELRDLAFERLSVAARSPDTEEGAAAAVAEKRILQARRAIAKAIGTLESLNPSELA